jgi:hypothetical protein
MVDETVEVAAGNREANTAALSLFPSVEALLFIMGALGFDRVEVLPGDAANEQMGSGKRVMVAGWIDP